MDQKIKQQIMKILRTYLRNGPRWKLGKDISHLNKRIRRDDVPPNFTMREYNDLIVRIIINKSSNVHLYKLQEFTQLYYVFSANNWIIIVGEDTIMETAMHSNNSDRYLSQDKGYTYLGTVEEVLKWKTSN